MNLFLAVVVVPVLASTMMLGFGIRHRDRRCHSLRVNARLDRLYYADRASFWTMLVVLLWPGVWHAYATTPALGGAVLMFGMVAGSLAAILDGMGMRFFPPKEAASAPSP